MATGAKEIQTEKPKSDKGYKQYVEMVDKGVYVFGALSLSMTVPQILKIFVQKTAAGVSVVTWIAYLFSNVFWIAYGLAHRSKAILIVNIIWIVLDLIIIAGIISYS